MAYTGKKSIGIVGMGFVGSAIHDTFSKFFNVNTYDKYNPNKSTVASLEELCSVAGIIFVCVPTPMKESGECDTSIVEAVCVDCDKFSKKLSKKNIVVIKSTVVPGTTVRLNKLCKNISVAFNPEFLTEANAKNDFKNQEKIIIGDADNIATSLAIKRLYQDAFPGARIVTTNATVAEMVKYCLNTFLALKVSFANEMYQICDKLNIDYKELTDIVKLDHRIGNTHWQVPGPMPASDGSGRLLPGFSGSCFVKDINALIHCANQLGIDPKVLLGAWNKNLEVRPEKDWEYLKGRAVTKSKD